MKNFNNNQQVLLRLLGLEFNFQPGNIKFKVLAFQDDEKALAADKLVQKAEAAKDIVQKYVTKAVPNGVTGSIREQYEKTGRAITLTDDAANWLASQKSFWPPIPPGVKVQTLLANEAMRKERTQEGWNSRQWGVEGTVIHHHDSHGLSYEVRHPDGTIGHYDPSEIEVL